MVFLSASDPYVTYAWGQLLRNVDLGPIDDGFLAIIFTPDPDARFSITDYVSLDLIGVGMDVRIARYAAVMNANFRRVTYYLAEDSDGIIHK